MAKYKAYPEYKDSGVEWLGMVPSHWNIKRLGQFFEERRDKVSDKDYPPLSVTMQGIVPQIDTAAKTDAGDNRKLVLKNDFVINSRSDRKGSSGVSQLDGSVSLISIVMEPKRINPKFAHHLLRSYPFQEEFYRYGKGIVADLWSTNSSEMKNILIPELADDESNAIACFLDHETAKIDNLIEKQQQLIELLKEKRQTVISHAVTKGLNPDVPMKDSGVEWLGEVPEHWIVSGFKKYLSSIVDYRGKTPNKTDDGIFLVTARNIKKGVLDYTLSQEFIAPSDYKEVMSRGLPDIGDVLFTTEAPLGEVANVDRVDIALAQRIIKFKGMTSRLDNYYFKYFIMSSAFQQSLNLYSSGSTAQGIKAERFVYLRKLLPPINEQIEIVGFLDKEITKIDILVEQQFVMLSLLQERRTALISAAVTGKIDVRDWVAPDTQDVEEPQEANA